MRTGRTSTASAVPPRRALTTGAIAAALVPFFAACSTKRVVTNSERTAMPFPEVSFYESTRQDGFAKAEIAIRDVRSLRQAGATRVLRSVADGGAPARAPEPR
ncbi:MAG: hypothetical protein ACREQ9_15550 [Candidatus Binatia bacterium]